MSNLIDRQAAIEALTKEYYYHDADYMTAVSAINALPAEPEPCEDAVSKETILKFLDDWMSVLDENCHNQSVSDLKIIKRDFENLPSVTPKQRTGKWVLICDNNGMHFICDKCGAWRYHQEQKFCGECGAKMEGKE